MRRCDCLVTGATINKLKRRIYGQTFCLSQLSKVNTSVSVSQIHENNLGIQHIHRKSKDESGDHELVKKSEFHNFQSSKLTSKVPIRSRRNHRLVNCLVKIQLRWMAKRHLNLNLTRVHKTNAHIKRHKNPQT